MLSTQPVADVAANLIELGLVDEVRAALPQLRAEATMQAGPGGVRLALEEWFAIFPQPKRSEAEWLIFYQHYVAICGAQPRAAIRAAMKSWAEREGSQFLPKPGELRALAASIPTPSMKLFSRSQAAVRMADDEVERQRIESDIAMRNTTAAEQVTAVTTMLGQFERESAASRERQRLILQRGRRNVDKPGASYRLPPGQTAPGSPLTPQMLRLLGRPVPGEQAGDEPPSEMI